MKKPIKGMQAIVLILMFILFVAGCGNAKNTADGGASETIAPAAATPIEIEFWHGVSELIDKMTEAYNRSQTKVIVKSVVVPNYYDGIVEKLQVQAAAKKMPDVVTMGLNYTKFAIETMHAISLEPFIKKDAYDTSDYFPSMLNLGKTSEGQQIGMPFGISTPVLFYNADQFREAGLNPDAPPKTWDELSEYAKKLTTNGHYGVSVNIDYAWLFQALLQTLGGSMMAPDGKTVGIDSQAGVKTMKYVSDLINADKSMPLLTNTQGWEAMSKGSISMFVNTSSGLETIRSQAKYELRTAPFPMHEGKRFVPAGGANLMIFAADKAKQEASWDFIKYLTDTKQAIPYAKSTGYMVSRKSSLNDPDMAQYLKDKPAAKATYDQVDQMVPWFNFPGTGGSKFAKIISDQVQAAMQNQKTPEQAMKDAAAQANPLIR
ncbi:ABC transporter substrate-binding protein [Paenibacillus hodogayensis]|uniref:ABC transporter substrate-binding protein n=1 Tax=Paenibacillus hodogayensis TaxID=279208 RepID=A0ABV5W338_9BACL